MRRILTLIVLLSLTFGPAAVTFAQPEPEREPTQAEDDAADAAAAAEAAAEDAAAAAAEGEGEDSEEPDAEEPDAEEPDAEEPDADAEEPDADAEEDFAADPYGDEEEEDTEAYEPAEAPSGPPQIRTVCHGRMIREIRVEGARRVEDDDVLANMRLRAGLPCTDDEIARDARALWDLGFFDDIRVEAELSGQQVDVLVTVAERPAIARIVFDGHDNVSLEDIEEKVTLRDGSILSVPDVRENVTKLRDLYAEEGYFLARVGYELRRLENDNNEVEVRFNIVEGSEVAVRRIRYIGNRNIPAEDLHEISQTSETGFFSFLSSDDTFAQETFDEDVLRLQAYYYDQGYLAMQVGTPRIELTPDRRYIDITIPIEEGPRFRIGRLSIAEVDAEGTEVDPLGGRETLLEEVQADPGDWFSRSAIAESLQGVTRTYRDAGYARVEINPETDLDLERRIVDIVISIRRGPPVYIERINIGGNSKTRDRVVRREMEILEGELYSQTAIERSRARVNALGYFERVDVSEEEGSGADQMVLNFEVAERATGTFQVGAGFSSIESFILTAQIQQNNLFGNGQALSLQIQLSGIRQLVTVRFTEPYFFGTRWAMSVDVFKTIRQFTDFNRDSTGGGLTFGHPILDNRLRFALGYRAELVDIRARTGGVFGSGGASGLSSLQRVPIANLFRDGLTSSLRLSLTWDSRDNRLFPTAGVFSSYSLEVADRFLGSENIFIRHTAFARFYRKIWGPFVAKLNTQFGLISSRQNQGVPIFERYYLGGIFNVRGYPLNSLGPHAGLPRSTDPNAFVDPSGLAVGGNMQFFYQFEIEFPIVESVGIRGVLFTDGGNAWNLEDNLCQAPIATNNDGATSPCGVDFNLRYSYGFGFRWFSPLGPLRFEWGIPINPRPNERKLLFEFTIGNSF